MGGGCPKSFLPSNKVVSGSPASLFPPPPSRSPDPVTFSRHLECGCSSSLWDLGLVRKGGRGRGVLVTWPAGKGPSGRMRTAEQPRTGHGYPATLWVCRHVCVIYPALCACAFVPLCASASALLYIPAWGIFCLQMHVDLGVLCVPAPNASTLICKLCPC